MQKIKFPVVAAGLIYATLSLLTACSDKAKPAPAAQPKQAVYFMLGDPMNLIYGTTRNRHVNFKSFRNVEKLYLFSSDAYLRWSELDPQEDTSASAEKGNEPRGREEFSPKFNENAISMDGNILSISLGTSTLRLTENAKGKATAAQIVQFGFIYDWNLQHYSESRDGNIISITLNYDDGGNNQKLLVLYFSKSKEVKQTETIEKNYYYLTGTGHKLGWAKKSTVTLDICGGYALEIKDEIEEAAAEWQTVLGDRLTLKTNVPASYTPFSDLNQKCIYVINDFMALPTNNYLRYAVTNTTLDLKNGLVADSDIMLFPREFEKNSDNPLFTKIRGQTLKGAIIHEMGHLLGLHHQFEKDDKGVNVPSVMSYSEKPFMTPQAYDIEALQELYK